MTAGSWSNMHRVNCTTSSCCLLWNRFTSSAVIFRSIAILVIGCLCVYVHEVDDALERAWQTLRANSWFQHESFEPFLSVASFSFFIAAWGFLDFFIPSASEHRIHPSDDLSSWFGGTRIRDQTLWYIAPLVTLDLLFPRRELPGSAPSLLRLVLEVVGAIAVYDVVFFAWHATLHSHPGLYRRVHATHHRCQVQRAPEAVRHTFIDGTMDVACSVFALNVVSCHPLSRAVYDVVIIGLITELHAGYDFPWQLHNLVPFGILGGPPRHDRHHREGGVYLQKFGTYLDEAFGFVPGGGRGGGKDRGRARSSVARRVLTAVSRRKTERRQLQRQNTL